MEKNVKNAAIAANTAQGSYQKMKSKDSQNISETKKKFSLKNILRRQLFLTILSISSELEKNHLEPV